MVFLQSQCISQAEEQTYWEGEQSEMIDLANVKLVNTIIRRQNSQSKQEAIEQVMLFSSLILFYLCILSEKSSKSHCFSTKFNRLKKKKQLHFQLKLFSKIALH